jgi:hypothetical protein
VAIAAFQDDAVIVDDRYFGAGRRSQYPLIAVV